MGAIWPYLRGLSLLQGSFWCYLRHPEDILAIFEGSGDHFGHIWGMWEPFSGHFDQSGPTQRPWGPFWDYLGALVPFGPILAIFEVFRDHFGNIWGIRGPFWGHLDQSGPYPGSLRPILGLPGGVHFEPINGAQRPLWAYLGRLILGISKGPILGLFRIQAAKSRAYRLLREGTWISVSLLGINI